MQVSHLVLRRLHSNIVADVVLRVEVERRRGLEAAAQAGEHGVGHVVLAVADLLGASPIDIDRPVRQIEGLLDTHVGGAWNMADLFHHVLGQIVVLVDGTADDLHVNLRWKAEVQDLAHHVGRQIVELRTRELLRELVTQSMGVLRSWTMLFSKGYEDVGIACAYRCRVRIGEVQTRVRNADVVDDRAHLRLRNLLANHILDLIAEPGGIFNARAGVGSHMKLELAAIDRGEEVLSQPWIEESDGTNPESDDRNQEDSTIFHAEAQDAVVPVAQFFEVVFEGDLEADERVAACLRLVHAIVFVPLQQVLCHGGDDGSREEVGGQHREDDCLGQGHEEISSDAAEEEHRDKHDADGEGRDESRNGDLRGASEDGVFYLFAFFKVAVDVLDFDGCVVHQDADGQREAAEGHDVDGFTERRQHQQRTDDGQRDRHSDDKS